MGIYLSRGDAQLFYDALRLEIPVQRVIHCTTIGHPFDFLALRSLTPSARTERECGRPLSYTEPRDSAAADAK